MSVIDWILQHPEAVIALLAVAASMLPIKKWVADKRAQVVLSACDSVFQALEEMGAKGQLPTGVTKGAAFLDTVDKWLIGLGQEPLSESEKVTAVLRAKAVNAAMEQAKEAANGSPH